MGMIMKRCFLLVAVLTITAAASHDCAFARADRAGFRLADSVRGRVECSRRMLAAGDLNGAFEQWLAADGFLYRLSGDDLKKMKRLSKKDVKKHMKKHLLKNNRKNVEMLSGLCRDVNNLSDTILGTLFRNRDYARLQRAEKRRRAIRWSEDSYGYSRWGLATPIALKEYGSDWPEYPIDVKFDVGDTAGVDVEQYLYFLRKLRHVKVDNRLYGKSVYSYGEGSYYYIGLEKRKEKGVFFELPLMDKEACAAAELYWKWFEKFVDAADAPETVYLQKQYEAKYGGKYGWDLTKIYGPMYSDYAGRLIKKFWLDDLRVVVTDHTRHDKRDHTKYGREDDYEYRNMFGPLCRLDRRLAARYAKMYGYKDLYAEAISVWRPEEAFEISENSEYLKLHQENLKKWNMTEDEYQRSRASFGSWDEFYSYIEIRERNIARSRQAEAESRRRSERDAQMRENERRAEARQYDKVIADEYKPRIVSAMSKGDYSGAERLANEALDKMKGGDAYMYYVLAHAYYRKTLDFDLGAHENAHEYFRAYRSEALRLVEMCNRSLGLDGSSSNDAYFIRGLAYVVLGYTDSAISDFERLSDRPGETGAAACYNIGIAAKNAKRWGSAIEAFKRARERSSSESMRSESLTHIKSCREKLK